MSGATGSNNSSLLNNNNSWHWWQYLLAILATLILLSVPLYFFVAKPKIEARILETLCEKLECDSVATYQSFELSLFSRQLQIKGLHLSKTADTLSSGYDFSSSEIKVSGVSILKAWRKNEIEIEEIYLSGSLLKLYGPTDSFLKNGKATADSTARQNIKKVKVANILLENVSLQQFSSSQNEKADMLLDSLNLDASGFELLQDTASNSPFTLTAFQFDFARTSLLTKNKLYRFELGKVSGDSEQQYLEVNDLYLRPLLSEEEFTAAVKTDEARLPIRVATFKAQRMDLLRAATSGEIIIGNAAMEKFSLYAYKDNTYPHPQDIRPLPHLLLGRLKTLVHIDTMTVRNSFVEFKMKGKKTAEIGAVDFQRIFMTLYNITNDPATGKDVKIVADSKSSFMGKAPLNVRFVFYPLSPIGSYTYTGTLGRLPLFEVNQMIRPVLGVEANSGTVESIAFDVQADDTLATGEMEFLYSDLKIALMDLDKNKKKALLSGLANLSALNKSNVKGSDDYRQGNIHFHRNRTRAIFHQMWNGLATGIASVVVHDYILKEEMKSSETGDSKKKRKGWFGKKKGK